MRVIALHLTQVGSQHGEHFDVSIEPDTDTDTDTQQFVASEAASASAFRAIVLTPVEPGLGKTGQGAKTYFKDV